MTLDRATVLIEPVPDIVTVEYVEQCVAHVLHISGDDESAHVTEDALHRLVLHAIAEGKTPDSAGIARAALKTCDINFSRWCS